MRPDDIRYMKQQGEMTDPRELLAYIETLEKRLTKTQDERDGLWLRVEELKARCEKLEKAKAAAYSERNNVVAALAHVEIRNDELKTRCEKLEKAKAAAYSERNNVVAALAKLFPAGLGKHDEADSTWERDWMNIAFIDLPTGQVSWHLHDSDLPLFVHLKPYAGKWDGHSTEEKYRRLHNLDEGKS